MGGRCSKLRPQQVEKISKPRPQEESKVVEEISKPKPKEESKPEKQYSDESITLKILTLGGNEHQVKAEPLWSVEQLIAELLEVLKLSDSSTEMITMVLTFGDVELDGLFMLQECGLCEGSEITVLVKKEPRPVMRDDSREDVDDIGVFESQKLGSPGSDWLQRNAPLSLVSEVHNLVSLLAGRRGAEYKEINSLGLEGLDKVRDYMDYLFEEKMSKQGDAFFNRPDFKIALSPQKLMSLVGLSQFLRLVTVFGNEPDEIVVRRCQAHGRCINFHIDRSQKVMQVALNSDEEYHGGRLVFATDAGLKIPKRNVGTVTLHHNDIVHGVTELEGGIRYGLFFLDKFPKSMTT